MRAKVIDPTSKLFGWIGEVVGESPRFLELRFPGLVGDIYVMRTNVEIVDTSGSSARSAA